MSGLLKRLARRYRHNGEGQPCADDPMDILREEMPGLPEEVYEHMVAELGPDQIISGRIERGEAMESLLQAEQADVLKLILFRLYEAPKPRLAVGCLLLSIGIKPIGISSERDLARQQHVSPEHVNNEVGAWREALQLSRTEFQKSDQAVEAARLHNKIKHKEAA